MAWAKGDSYERLMGVVQYAAWKEFDRPSTYDAFGEMLDPGFCTAVLGTFSDVIVFEDVMSEKLYEATYVLNGDMVVFGRPVEVQEMYAEKRMAEIGQEFKLVSKQEYTELELSGPIVYKSADEAKRIAYAAVLVPGEPDSDGEILTAGKIEEAAHGWMESYRNVDLMHTLNNTGVPVESYILNEAMKVEAYGNPIELPAGTWILASKLSEEAWKGVEDGVLTGYSVMGIKKAHLESATKSEEGELDDAAFKRTLLADLGPDWVAAFVSVVDHPAVPKAKFFALKSKEFSDAEAAEDHAPDGPRFFAKMGRALGITKSAEVLDTVVDDEITDSVEKSTNDVVIDSAEKAGRRYSDKTYESIKTAYEALSALMAEAESERAVPEDDEEDDEDEDAVKSEDTSEGPVTDMDEAQLQASIAEAVKSAVEPLVNRLDALEAAPKSEAVEPELDAAVEEPVAEKTADEEVVEAEKSEDDAVEKAEDVEDVEEAEKSEDVEDEIVADEAEKSEEAPEIIEEPVEKSEDVEEVVEAAEKSEEIEAVDTTAEEIASLKSAVEAAEEQAAEYAAFKAEMAEKVETLEKRLSRVATASKALPNDGSGSSEEPVEDTSGRDAFGRRIR